MRRDPGNEERFANRDSFAGVLQPGDKTRYEMIVTDDWDTIDVVVLNDGFFDKITFLKNEDRRCISTFRGDDTNPWIIRAAREMMERFLGIWEEKE
jgi:hypothetical protein